jgi:hypothetical protein
LGEKNPKYEYNKRAFPLKKAYKKDKKEIKEGGRERERAAAAAGKHLSVDGRDLGQ